MGDAVRGAVDVDVGRQEEGAGAGDGERASARGVGEALEEGRVEDAAEDELFDQGRADDGGERHADGERDRAFEVRVEQGRLARLDEGGEEG